MNIELELHTEKNEIEDLNDFIREGNLKGVITQLKELPAEKNAMSIADYEPVIKLVLSSTVVGTAIKGVFDLIKTWLEIKEREKKTELEKEKIKSEEKKVTFTKTSKSGKIRTITIHAFDEKERENLLTFFKD